MEYKVTLQQSEHHFVTHENENILESGLRSGLNLKYYCDNGSCGECSARLISGDIHQQRKTDYCFTEVQKDQGYFLPCVCEARSDLIIDAEELQDADDIPTQKITAKVKKLQQLSDEIMIMTLRTPRGSTFGFLAGQSALVELPNGDSRMLPIGSCPCDGKVLEFHVRRKTKDAFSHYIFDEMKSGENVTIVGPRGQMTLDDDMPKPMIFFANSTGFAGIKSLIEHAIALDVQQQIHLVRLHARETLDYMNNICRSWVDAVDNIHVHDSILCSDEKCNALVVDERAWRQVQGYFKDDPELLMNADIYLSGVSSFVDLLSERLRHYGVPGENIKTQRVA